MVSADDLPIEIWRHILQLVPRGSRKGFHAVNRTFYGILMAPKYETVYWNSHVWSASRRSSTRALKSPLISPFIKELHISITASPDPLLLKFAALSSTSAESAQRRLALLGKHLRKAPLGFLPNLREDEARSFLATFAAPVKLSGRFPSLHKLIIVAGSAASELPFYHHLGTILKSPLQHALQSISGTLRLICLSIPLESYRDGLFSCDVSFPLLEELAFTLYAIYLTTDYGNIFESCIVPFVNQHSRSLTILSFSTSSRYGDYPQYLYKFELLFRDLSYIPGLSSLRFKWFILPSADTGLDELGHFIRAHAGTLSKLYIHIYHWKSDEYHPYKWRQHPLPAGPTFDTFSRLYTPSTLFRHTLFTQALPSCRALKTIDSILLTRSSFQSDPTPFVQWFPTLKCAETLTVLHLRQNWLDQADLIKLVSSVDLSSLRQLWVLSHPLSMALFDAFVGRLRVLEGLTLRISGVATRRNPSEIVVPQTVLPPFSPFVLDMQSTRYLGWTSLKTLSITLEVRNARPGPADEAPRGILNPEWWLEANQISHTFPSLHKCGAYIHWAKA